MTAALDDRGVLTIANQAVELSRRAGASDAEAWVSVGRRASVRVRGGDIDERTDEQIGSLTLRVFVDSLATTATTSDLTPDALQQLAEDAIALANLVDPDPAAGLPESNMLSNSVMEDIDRLDLVDAALVDPSPTLLIELAQRADSAARGHDPRVRSGEGATASSWLGTQALANSRGFAARYADSSCWIWVSTATDDAGGKKREGSWYAADRHLSGMEDAETVGRSAAERALRQLGARPVPTQEVPVVFAPEAAREFLSILAQAASGDARYRGFSFLIDREGDALASPLLTITDDATLPGRLGSRPFDAEGIASRQTPLIDAGTFSGFLYDTYSGRKASQRSTSNAGRSNHPGVGARISVAPSNLVMAPGESSPEAIIGSVTRGLYLTETLGFGENLTTGDFSRGAAGLWIEDGELTHSVCEVNIAGRLPEMLAGIDAVGNDATFVESASAPTFRIASMVVSGQ
jgi:PmbA protein